MNAQTFLDALMGSMQRTSPTGCTIARNSSEQYHADKDILSSSMLKDALVSPAHYIESLFRPKTRTEDMEFGTLIHSLVLEPDTALATIAIFTGDPADKLLLRKFKQQNPDLLCLTQAELIQAQVLADVVRSSKFRGREFSKYIDEGLVEPSLYFSDPTTGLRCRTRPDLMHPEFTFDLKTTRHALPTSFQKDAVSMHYDLSAYMYTLNRVLIEGGNPKPFVIVPVHSSAPFGTHFMPCSAQFLENGMKKYNTALSMIKACSDVDFWPALDGEVEMDIAPWQTYSAPDSTWRRQQHV